MPLETIEKVEVRTDHCTGQDESVPIESADPRLICAGVVDICEFDSEVSTADLDGASALRAAACSSSIRLLCRTSAEDSTALSRPLCVRVCVRAGDIHCRHCPRLQVLRGRAPRDA